ncbi:site-specific DNA-methyltransferase [Devosia sp. 1566]|uniref:site-specific DNA-methyltransferase n=1 Tax=Devosia sp. 1566 TaxID=2499144 RepID=UPI000FD8AEA9|nr:site-specific DNA-methyltransferase [Devosia sp. 1566]
MTHQSPTTTVWPADKVERRRLAELVPYARNARTHSPAQISKIAASIDEWGWTNPVLVDESGSIIAGHGRVLAAKKLGIVDVPVMVASGWTEAQRRAYVLADNRLALDAGWDEDLLRSEMADLGELGFDLPLTGFSEAELGKLLPEVVEGDADHIPAVPEQPASRPGDLWILGDHRIICGDSTDPETVARLLNGANPHLMVTDPPYGVDYDPEWRNRAGVSTTERLGKVENDHRADWREAWALFPGEVAYVWHAGIYATTVAESLLASGFSMRSQIIWAKPRLVLSRGHYHWQHEPCWYAVREGGQGHWQGARDQTTIWAIDGAGDNQDTSHSTQKPVECMRRPIQNNSQPGDGVYEPFSGSGTTIIAAELEHRRCYAVELSPEYVDVAVLRWQAFTGKEARLEHGPTFADVAVERRIQFNAQEPSS